MINFDFLFINDKYFRVYLIFALVVLTLYCETFLHIIYENILYI